MPDQFQPGQQVKYLHCPRGGSGYIFPVSAEVVRVSEKRVTIRTVDGKTRTVKAANLVAIKGA